MKSMIDADGRRRHGRASEMRRAAFDRRSSAR
jgi:hypothetical protein